MKSIKLHLEAALKLVAAIITQPNTDHVISFYSDHVQVRPATPKAPALRAGHASNN